MSKRGPVGDRLFRLRRNKVVDDVPMSQDALAEVTGIDRSYIGKIERGEIREPGIAVLEKLAEGLGVPVSELAPPGYYAKLKRGSEDAIVAMIWSDTSLSEAARGEAADGVRAVYAARQRARSA